MRDDKNIIPVTLAILLHAVIMATMVFAWDISGKNRPVMPLAVTATLVTEADMPTVTQLPDPEPVEQEPEPEPEPPQPDPDELERQRLEEAKRQADLQAEQERIRREQEAERERQQQAAEERRQREQAERERQAREAEERRQREEAEKERQRQEAEKRRLEEIERQRQENERKRREAEEAERQRRMQAELAEEERRLEAMQSGEMARYIYAIQQKIQRNWIQPPSAHAGIECVALVRQLPGGEVIDVRIESCNGDDAVRRSIAAAIRKASPLPQPANPSLFDRNLRIIVKPEQ